MLFQHLPDVQAHFVERPDRAEDGDGIVLALDPNPVQFEKGEIRYRLAGSIAYRDGHAIGLGQIFQPCAEVYRITHHGVRHPETRTHVADPHFAGIQTDANLDFRPASAVKPLLQLAERSLHFDRG